MEEVQEPVNQVPKAMCSLLRSSSAYLKHISSIAPAYLKHCFSISQAWKHIHFRQNEIIDNLFMHFSYQTRYVYLCSYKPRVKLNNVPQDLKLFYQ